MRTKLKRIFVVAFILLLGACTASPYSQRPLVGGNAQMNCETAVSTQSGYELACRGNEKLSKAEALEAMRQADIANYSQYAPPVSIIGVYSAYPHIITRGRYERRLYGGPKYTYGGYGYGGYTYQRWSFGNRH